MPNDVERMLSTSEVPTPHLPKKNPNMFKNLRGDVANGRTFRDARALSEMVSPEPVNTEEAFVSDVLEAERIVIEEMAKMLPPPEVKARWDEAVVRGEFRTWVQPRHRAVRFPLQHIIGGGQPGEKDPPVTVAKFRQLVQAAVLGSQGGSLHYTVRNQQYNGTWEPYEFDVWTDLMGGGTTVDASNGRVVGTGSPTRQLFLSVMFVDVSGNQPVVYDAKGIPNTDFAKGGAITEQMTELVKQLKAREDREVQAADAKVAAENAALTAQVTELRALVEQLLAAQQAPKPAETAEVEREHHKTREARLRREAAEAAGAAQKDKPE